MATWEKIVKHGTDYSKAITGSGNVYMVNGSAAMISIGSTDFLSELAVGQKVSIYRDGTTEVKEMATITNTTTATVTTNWGGSTGLCTAHVEPGVEIDVENIGTVLHADASRLSVKRLAVDAESGSFGGILNPNSVITANAGEKYYPMHLYGDRDSYGTAMYIQQAGDGDSLIIQKAGDGFWTTGIDNSTNLYSVAYDASQPFFSLMDVFLTIDTDGDVKLSADHDVSSDYSVATKEYVDDGESRSVTAAKAMTGTNYTSSTYATKVTVVIPSDGEYKIEGYFEWHYSYTTNTFAARLYTDSNTDYGHPLGPYYLAAGGDHNSASNYGWGYYGAYLGDNYRPEHFQTIADLRTGDEIYLQFAEWHASRTLSVRNASIVATRIGD